MNKMVYAYLAEKVHNINKIYCESIGDFTQVDWDKVTQVQRNGLIDAIERLIDDPTLSSEDLHNRWCECRRAEGWEYGEVKDVENKLHPCLVPYNQLPYEQIIKDNFIMAVVAAFKNISYVYNNNKRIHYINFEFIKSVNTYLNVDCYLFKLMNKNKTDFYKELANQKSNCGIKEDFIYSLYRYDKNELGEIEKLDLFIAINIFEVYREHYGTDI